MKNTRNLVLTGLLIALGIVLPLAFHSIPNAGSIFLPMHFTVLLCGLICGTPYGFIAGILTPFISSIATGMPPAAYLPAMVVELATYGILSGLLPRIIKTPSRTANIYISLILVMIGGRIVYGLINAMIFRAGDYSLQIWFTSLFITSLPGIIGQLVLIPVIIFALEKAKLIETRFA